MAVATMGEGGGSPTDDKKGMLSIHSKGKVWPIAQGSTRNTHCDMLHVLAVA